MNPVFTANFTTKKYGKRFTGLFFVERRDIDSAPVERALKKWNIKVDKTDYIRYNYNKSDKTIKGQTDKIVFKLHRA